MEGGYKKICVLQSVLNFLLSQQCWTVTQTSEAQSGVQGSAGAQRPLLACMEWQAEAVERDTWEGPGVHRTADFRIKLLGDAVMFWFKPAWKLIHDQLGYGKRMFVGFFLMLATDVM